MRSCIEDMVKHILYIKELVGIDYVGLGSDFDGIDQNLELADASMMPQLAAALQEAALVKMKLRKFFIRTFYVFIVKFYRNRKTTSGEITCRFLLLVIRERILIIP